MTPKENNTANLFQFYIQFVDFLNNRSIFMYMVKTINGM